MINENASEPNKFDQCVNVSTVVKSGNCSASLKSKNVVNVSGVLNKFARLIGSSAMPESRNAFVSLFSSLLSFDDDEDDDDDDDAIALIVLLLVIIFLAKPGGHRRDEDDAFLFVANPFLTKNDDYAFDVVVIVDVNITALSSVFSLLDMLV